MQFQRLSIGQRLLLAIAVPFMMMTAFALAALGLLLLRRKAKDAMNFGRASSVRFSTKGSEYFVIENDKVDPSLRSNRRLARSA